MENLAAIIIWKYNAEPLKDFLVMDGVIVEWNVAGVPKPTEAEVMAFEEDWIAAGGHMVRFRREAEATIDALKESGSLSIRAVVIESLAYANAQRQAFSTLLTWLGTQTTLTQRGQLAAMALAQATPAQAKAAIKGRIAAGEAD